MTEISSGVSSVLDPVRFAPRSEVEEPTRRRLNQRVVATGDRHRTLSGSSRRLNEVQRQHRSLVRRPKAE